MLSYVARQTARAAADAPEYTLLAAMIATSSRTIAITINRPWREVYAFASQPGNMPRWASGLGHSLYQLDGVWIAEGPNGRVRIVFQQHNHFGVLDHTVITSTGAEIYVPMRVIPNGQGSGVLLTLFRLPDMTDDRFALDMEWVTRDLHALKALMET
jgi:hypothetical protein